MADLHKGIRAIHNNVVSINGDTQEDIIAKDNSGNEVTINWTLVNNKIIELQTEYNAKQYQRDRIYPSIGDQLDMLWHSIDQTPALKSQYFDFYEAIKAVKVKYPKNG